ncbi:ribonuclease inhibitor [Burkholderia cenocepacia]|uniref:barstar family protein n=1 Tax=Burkholderia cenocepacia TaxID=95486 RepID=UPI000F5A6CCD|nr:barstar family protein [Burkholderia cenocepacia]RQT97095.1 ribonuclease inhibitor [Burkholderia cenocepacia]RQU53200.1 ribonuclease inhibitor [Burkholderia cenocepacia]
MARDTRVEIELDDIESTEQLHVRLMKKLSFPDWYGRNWDAFWDAITALVDMPLILRLKGWSECERRFPRDAKLMRDCLQDMARQYPAFAPRVEYD